jgi:hypothetical protein
MALVNAALRGRGRPSALYDQETLEFLLGRYGFRDARRIDAPGGVDSTSTIVIEALK